MTHLFRHITTEWLDYLPHDIDGTKIFKIKCLPRDCLPRFREHMTSGTQKVRKYIDNLYCPYKKCSFKFLMECGGP